MTRLQERFYHVIIMVLPLILKELETINENLERERKRNEKLF